jgi:hypothetical protein
VLLRIRSDGVLIVYKEREEEERLPAKVEVSLGRGVKELSVAPLLNPTKLENI